MATMAISLLLAYTILLIALCFSMFQDETSENSSEIEVIDSEGPKLIPQSNTRFLSRRPPVSTKYWVVAPDIVICNGSRVTVGRASRAMTFWRRLGYSFGEIIDNVQTGPCLGEMPRGQIVIDLIGQDFVEPNLAMTRTYFYTTTGEIVGARIEMKATSATKERVLEHEIGHALGWSHYNRRYHLMHEDWNHGGWDSYGLQRRASIRQIENHYDTLPTPVVYTD